ncbi:MAG: glycosyltransferase family 87 protein [Candidatus Limnocylindria bacterium]
MFILANGSRSLRLIVRALALAWLVFFWLWLIGIQSTFAEVDAEAYWGFDLATLYQGVQLGDQDAFLYSPVVAWLFAPFSNVPFEVFYALLAAVNLAALVWLLGPELGALSILLTPISNEVARGNIHLLLAVAIVMGFRYPASWAWVLLTKVTPGVGLLWFAFRRQWRQLGTALAVTAAIVAISFVIDPDLWLHWFRMLASNVGTTRPSVLEVPVLPRLAVAAGLVALGASRNRPAIVPVAAMLALPSIWVNSLALLVAVIPLWRQPPALSDSVGARSSIRK